MAIIPMTNGFTIIPEGNHIFRIYDVEYNPDFGKLIVKMVNAKGIIHIERFSLMGNDGNPNDAACNAFSYFAKTALNNFALEEIDHTDIIGRYIGGEITHTKLPSKKDPNETLTFANIGKKWVAEGFDTEPVEKALTLGTEDTKPAPAPKSESVDLNSLLD